MGNRVHDAYDLCTSRAQWSSVQYGFDYDELLSAAGEGLMSADEKYTEDKGPFRAFARVCIDNAIKSRVRSMKRRKSRTEQLSDDSDNRNSRGPDTKPSNTYDLRDALRMLLPNERDIIEKKYYQKMEISEIAESRNEDARETTRIMEMALHVLRQNLS